MTSRMASRLLPALLALALLVALPTASALSFTREDAREATAPPAPAEEPEAAPSGEPAPEEKAETAKEASREDGEPAASVPILEQVALPPLASLLPTVENALSPPSLLASAPAPAVDAPAPPAPVQLVMLPAIRAPLAAPSDAAPLDSDAPSTAPVSREETRAASARAGEAPRPAPAAAERAARWLKTPEGQAATAAAAVSIPALVGLALYARLRGSATLENATRRRLLDAMGATAGLSVEAAEAITGLTYSTVSYHLDRLVENGFAVREMHAGRILYFANGGAFNADDRAALALFRNTETMRVLADVLAHPATYRAAIAERLGVTGTAIGWHVKRLLDNGLLVETKDGRRGRLAVDAARLARLAPVAEKLGAVAPAEAAPVREFLVVGARPAGPTPA